MAGGGGTGQGGAKETRSERVNRELIELLNELRVALPGVQFLFAFLLVVPFQQRGAQITHFERNVYYVTLVAAAVSTALLIAPAAQHRVLFRKQDKEALLKRGSRSAFAGLVVLALAIASAVLLVIDVLFADRTRAWITAAVIGGLLVWWWMVVPLWHRARDADEDLDSLDDLPAG